MDAIGAALWELKAAGYIVRHKLRDRQGRISDTEYVIYEQPQLRKPDTDSPDTENPDMDSPGYGKARRIKCREIKYSKTKYLWIKYRFHSLSGLRGRLSAGTEGKGCDVTHRDRELSGIDMKKHWL